MIFLYQTLLLLASPLVLVWIALRLLRGKLPGLRERFGFLPGKSQNSGLRIWIHGVSLGEIKVAASLAEDLRRSSPDLSIVFTTSTHTGRQEALRHATARDSVLYPPVDLGWVCRRFLRHFSPKLVLVVETELWPNLFRQARLSGIPLMIVNGRLSDKSWPRYRATRWFWRTVLKDASRIYASSAVDATRFRQIGVSADKLVFAGNMKFHIQPKNVDSKFIETALAFRGTAPTPKIIVAGSTMAGEEEILINTLKKLNDDFPSLWTILAPRHPERFGEVAELLARAGVPFSRRSQWEESDALPKERVMLLDTMGELSSVYQVCDVAFVGGTLVPSGGHNIVEPAMWAKPVVVGPSMENFKDILNRFMEEDAGVRIPGARVGGVVQVGDADGLFHAVKHLLSNPQDATRLGASAKTVLVRNQESSSRTIEELAKIVMN